MTDITELALLVSKAKASVFTLEYISQFEPADIDSDDVDLRFEVDGRDTGTNVSIVDECGQAAKVIGTLVEALEYYKSREERVTSLVRDNSKSWDELYRQVEAKGKRNVELVEALASEKRICATWRKTAEANSEKLEKAQQVDEELCKLLPPGAEYMDPPDGGDVTPLEGVRRMVVDYRQRIAELESRTVKLPEPFELAKSSSGLTYYYADEVDAALTAAGIKVEVD
ncbi:ead/Ea22-like family protein [Klebsiella pneumoniae]|uniref:ead/Ea22-like family protein n=1 Tax=Klebsiella pneumoniae TaxID=573 RepID=UPI003F55DFF3